MKKTEIALLLFCFASLAMKHFDIVPGNLFNVIAWSSISVYYFFLTINFNDEKVNLSLDAASEPVKKMSVLDLFTCITLSEISIGILFRTQHWPNGEFFIVTGLAAMILTLILRVVVSRRKSIPVLNMMMIRLLLLCMIGLLCIFKPI